MEFKLNKVHGYSTTEEKYAYTYSQYESNTYYNRPMDHKLLSVDYEAEHNLIVSLSERRQTEANNNKDNLKLETTKLHKTKYFTTNP